MRRLTYIGALFLLLTGCIPLIVGGGIVTGYALSNDSAMGNVKCEYRVLWDLCLDKLETMEAEVLYANESRGKIKAKVSDNSVTIKITTAGSELQRLKVTARKFLLPKPQFAQKVFFKIVQDL